MKPLKLIMSAFGPYAEETVVDFAALGRDGIYLIAGDTGAGKTTIFDAISFALYGEASGGRERRKSKSFRSDYAPLTAETFVELTFQHRDATWIVRRNPEYIRARKTGTGTTRIPSGASLTRKGWNGEIDGPMAVDAKISELLGLTQDQFTQTVMIAQGDFLKILNASSETRKGLFQKLFNTSVYAKLQKKLGEMNTACSREREDLDRRISLAAARIDPEPDFPERENIVRCKAETKYADLLAECTERLIAREREAGGAAAKEKAEADREEKRLIALTEQAKAANADFAALARAEETLSKLIDRQTAADTLRERLDAGRKAQSIEADEARLADNQLHLQKQRQENAEAGRTLEAAQSRLPEAEARQREAQARAGEADALQSAADQLMNCIPVLAELEKQRADLKSQRERMQALLAAFSRADEACAAAKHAYFSSQAGLLARELREGEACPVCGSTSHPCPAALTAEAVTREDMERAEERRSQAYQALNEADKRASATETAVDSAKKRLEELGLSEDATRDSLQRQIVEKRGLARQYRDAITRTGEELNRLRVAIGRSATAVEQGMKRLEELERASKALKAAFAGRLADAGFADERAYQMAKMSAADMDQAEKRLRAYGEQKQSLTDQVADLRARVSGKAVTDVSALETEARNLRARKEAAEKTETAYAKKRAIHEDALREIREARRQQSRRENNWAVVRDLYNCCAGITGGNNRAKLTFEAYVQQVYFKRVVSAANKRLTVLTDGQFTLRCRETAADRVHQSGLDLEVLDRATGQWRDVNTLSGGESFLASLALALGLSDTAQAQSGGIRLDAMFIDEGFGTLDENALRNSLQVLSDLADGKRQIGIISHVHDLEDRIEKQILVTKTLRGSRVELVV